MLTKDDSAYPTKLGELLRQYLHERGSLPSPYLVRDAEIGPDGSARVHLDGIFVWNFPAEMVREICERYVETPKLMAALQWRKEPPDKPGWWWRKPSTPDCIAVIERIRNSSDGLYVDSEEGGCMLKHFPGDEWSGPIEPPKQ